MTHIVEDLTHKMEGQPSKKEATLVPGIHVIHTWEGRVQL